MSYLGKYNENPCFFIALLELSVASQAQDRVIFETDEQVKETLLNHKFVCEWKDAFYSGTDELTYEEASLNSVTGKVKISACPGNLGLFKGKYKKALSKDQLKVIRRVMEALQ